MFDLNKFNSAFTEIRLCLSLNTPYRAAFLRTQFFYFLILWQVRFPRKQKLRWGFGWTGKENKERLGRERCQAWQSLERSLSTSSGGIWRWVNTSEITSFQVRCPGFYTEISLRDVDGKNVLSSVHPRGGWKLRQICICHGWQICIHSQGDTWGAHFSIPQGSSLGPHRPLFVQVLRATFRDLMSLSFWRWF